MKKESENARSRLKTPQLITDSLRGEQQLKLTKNEWNDRK